MLKTLILLSAVLCVPAAMAGDVVNGYGTSYYTNVSYSSYQNPFFSFLSPQPQTATRRGYTHRRGGTSGGSGYRAHFLDAACNNFMKKGKTDAEGKPTYTINKYGKSVLALLKSEKYSSTYENSNALTPFCPAFASLSQPEKDIAWVGFWRGLAQEESSCTNAPSNGIEVGMFQMEASAAQRARLRRGPECKEVASFEGNLRCSVSILAKNSFGGRSHSINDSLSYWGPVRRFHDQLELHMRALGICGDFNDKVPPMRRGKGEY